MCFPRCASGASDDVTCHSNEKSTCHSKHTLPVETKLRNRRHSHRRIQTSSDSSVRSNHIQNFAYQHPCVVTSVLCANVFLVVVSFDTRPTRPHAWRLEPRLLLHALHSGKRRERGVCVWREARMVCVCVCSASCSENIHVSQADGVATGTQQGKRVTCALFGQSLSPLPDRTRSEQPRSLLTG